MPLSARIRARVALASSVSGANPNGFGLRSSGSVFGLAVCSRWRDLMLIFGPPVPFVLRTVFARRPIGVG
jgi:hypothetical protein